MSNEDSSRTTTQERSSAGRYLVTAANMDISGPLLGAEPTVISIIVDATSRADAEAFARQFALDCAEQRAAWLEEAEGLTLEEAQQILAENGLYVADPVVELLSDVDVCTTSRAACREQDA